MYHIADRYLQNRRCCFRNTAIKYQINVYRRTLDDVHWNGEKYDYQLLGKIPAFAQLEWICTPDATSVRISTEGLAENEFIVMSVLPMQDEHYVMQSGTSVWVF